MIRASNGGHSEVISCLIARGADVNLADKVTTHSLAKHTVIVTSVNLFLPSLYQHGDTPLIHASYKGHLPVVKRLVAAGANVNIANSVQAQPTSPSCECRVHATGC